MTLFLQSSNTLVLLKLNHRDLLETTKLVCFKHPLKKVVLSALVALHTSISTSCDCIPIQYVNSVKCVGIYLDSYFVKVFAYDVL